MCFELSQLVRRHRRYQFDEIGTMDDLNGSASRDRAKSSHGHIGDENDEALGHEHSGVVNVEPDYDRSCECHNDVSKVEESVRVVSYYRKSSSCEQRHDKNAQQAENRDKISDGMTDVVDLDVEVEV